MNTKEDFEIFNSYVIDKEVCPQGEEVLWEIKTSPLGGRGLFAKKSIPANRLLFADPPLVLGPRSEIHICVGCHKSRGLIPCSKRCGLPVCGLECERSERHESECALLNSWKNGNGNGTNGKSWDKKLLMCLTPIRCCFLTGSDLKVLESLEGHESQRHQLILKILNDNFHLDPEKLKIIKTGCEVLDATAFETVSPHENETGSLRGIYPLAALMNHDCSPNTRHSFDSSNKMIVETSKRIEKGEEITTTYTNLTWGNQTRRHHLSLTKKFKCGCKRCGDPEEFGARLQAIYCLRNGCTGVLMPDETAGCWFCVGCGSKSNVGKIGRILTAIGSVLAKVDPKDLKGMSNVLKEKSLVPNCNQIAIDFKFNLVWLYGNRKGFEYEDLTDDELMLKELLCRELLMTLKVLKLGDCRLKGLLLVELHRTLVETTRRHGNDLPSGHKNLQKFQVVKDDEVLEEAKIILRYDHAFKKLFRQND